MVETIGGWRGTWRNQLLYSAAILKATINHALTIQKTSKLMRSSGWACILSHTPLVGEVWGVRYRYFRITNARKYSYSCRCPGLTWLSIDANTLCAPQLCMPGNTRSAGAWEGAKELYQLVRKSPRFVWAVTCLIRVKNPTTPVLM